MKFIKNILTILLVVGLVGSCGIDDKLINPNQISPEQASLNDLYNSIQLDFRNVYTSAQRTPGNMARMYHTTSFLYESAASSSAFNGLWGNAYNNLFPNIDALLKLSEGQGFDIHVGSSMIMKAYTLMVLVDLIGNVPFSEAGKGTDVISPIADPGADVYAAAITMLDDAIAILNGTVAAAPAADNFYNGDAVKWITAANTFKKRAYLNMGDPASYNAIADFIDTPDEDFEFQYGTTRLNPNSRHWMYNSHYESGDGDYIPNYYMWLLRAEKLDGGGTVMRDPRLRYYFIRKVDDAVGQDATTYSCHFSALPDPAETPAHYLAVDPRMPYCVAAADGYSGRDHLNGEGIPPDGPIRTSYGLYPGGGDFDDDSFDDTRNTGASDGGGAGAGINPIMLSSYGKFMQAEAVLSIGATGNARTLLREGIQQSMDKVESFESLVSSKMSTEITLRDGSTGTIKELFGMDNTAGGDVENYITEVTAMYDAAGSDQERLAIVIKEYMIAAYGNGLEAYNMYRRTGYPDNMMPALEPAPGPFPLSFFYPINSETRNANITQKDDLTEPVFWQDAGIAATLY